MYLIGDKRKRGIDFITKIDASFSFIDKNEKKKVNFSLQNYNKNL